MHTTRSSPYRLWIAGQVQNPTGLDQSIADWQKLELKVMLTSKMISKKKADQYFFHQYWNLVKTADLNLHLLFHKNNYRVEHYMLALEIIQRNT